MPDTRIRLRDEGPSLLNVPTPVFQGPAHSLYGPAVRLGPPLTTGRGSP